MIGQATDRQNRLFVLALIALAAVAVWFRARALTVWPFWVDEAFSALAAENGIRFIWTTGLTYETHPPLYYSLLSLWVAVLGSSNFTYRILGVLVGLATLVALGFAAREVARIRSISIWPVVLAVVALGAVAPVYLDIARLVRPYYLIMLAMAVGCWALLRLYRDHGRGARLSGRPWFAYLGSSALLIWLHTLGALYSAALGLALLALIGPRALIDQWRTVLIGHLAIIALAVPVFIIILDQAPSWAASTWLKFSWEQVGNNLPVIYGLRGAFGGIALIVLGGAAVLGLGRVHWRVSLALILAATIPAALAILLSIAFAPVFLPRTLVGCAVPITLLMGLGGAFGLIQRIVLAAQIALAAQYSYGVQQLPPIQDWTLVARWLDARMRPGDLVYAYPNEGSLSLRVALRDQKIVVPIRDIPGPIPARDPQGYFPTGNRAAQSLKPARLREIASDPVSERTPTIWLLRLAKHWYDKGNEFELILRERRTVIDQLKSDQIEVVGLRRSALPPPPEQPQP